MRRKKMRSEAQPTEDKMPTPKELKQAMEEAGSPLSLRAAQAIISGHRGISAWRLAKLGEVRPEWATWQTVAAFAERRAQQVAKGVG